MQIKTLIASVILGATMAYTVPVQASTYFSFGFSSGYGGYYGPRGYPGHWHGYGYFRPRPYYYYGYFAPPFYYPKHHYYRAPRRGYVERGYWKPRRDYRHDNRRSHRPYRGDGHWR